MDRERLKHIVSVLERGELTLRERQFVEGMKKYLNEDKKVTDQQESVLEGIYKEKIWMRKAFLSQNNLPKTSPSKAL
jgi:exonuclease VII small subunit